MIAKNTYQVYSYSNDSPDINFRHHFMATRFMMTWKKFAKAIKTKIFFLFEGGIIPAWDERLLTSKFTFVGPREVKDKWFESKSSAKAHVGKYLLGNINSKICTFAKNRKQIRHEMKRFFFN